MLPCNYHAEIFSGKFTICWEKVSGEKPPTKMAGIFFRAFISITLSYSQNKVFFKFVLGPIAAVKGKCRGVGGLESRGKKIVIYFSS